MRGQQGSRAPQSNEPTFEQVGWVTLIRSNRSGLHLVRGRFAAELLRAIGVEAQPARIGYLLPESRVDAFLEMAELFDVAVHCVTIGGRRGALD